MNPLCYFPVVVLNIICSYHPNETEDSYYALETSKSEKDFWEWPTFQQRYVACYLKWKYSISFLFPNLLNNQEAILRFHEVARHCFLKGDFLFWIALMKALDTNPAGWTCSHIYPDYYLKDKFGFWKEIALRSRKMWIIDWCPWLSKQELITPFLDSQQSPIGIACYYQNLNLVHHLVTKWKLTGFGVKDRMLWIQESMSAALEGGSVGVVSFLWSTLFLRYTFLSFEHCKPITITCQTGNLPLLKYLFNHPMYLCFTDEDIQTAVRQGHAKLIEYLFHLKRELREARYKRHPVTLFRFIVSASLGNASVVKHLCHSKVFPRLNIPPRTTLEESNVPPELKKFLFYKGFRITSLNLESKRNFSLYLLE